MKDLNRNTFYYIRFKDLMMKKHNLINQTLFNIKLYRIKRKLKQLSTVLTYSILISLEYEKEWYYNNFLSGISIKKSILTKLDNLKKEDKVRMNRKISEKTLRRYNKMRENNFLKNNLKTLTKSVN